MDTIVPQDNTPYKRCSNPNCKNPWLPATTEYFHVHHKGVLRPLCKECRSKSAKVKRKEHPEIQQQYYASHREEKLQYAAQYRAEHREEHAQYCARYNVEHKEELKEKRAQRYAEHREEHKDRNARNYREHAVARRRYASQYRVGHSEQVQSYREVHRTEHRFYDRRYHQEHREQKSRSSAIYRQEHREELNAYRRWYSQTERGRVVHRAATHRRKARKRAVAGTYTAAQIQEQLKRQHYCCYYAACGFAKFKRVRQNGAWKYLYEIEHTFPLSRVVGTDIPANDISYLVLSCPSCNSKKRDKFPWEFFEGGRLL